MDAHTDDAIRTGTIDGACKFTVGPSETSSHLFADTKIDTLGLA